MVPQPGSRYRDLDDDDQAYMRDMYGEPVDASGNPGVRLEPGFVTEAQEERLVEELQAILHYTRLY